MKYSLVIGAIVILLLVLFAPYGDKTIFKHGYFDANGTTPLHPKALAAYNRASVLGNASAGYADAARDIVHKAQALIAERTFIDANEYQIIFNAGASQGNCLLLRSIAMAPWDLNGLKPHIIMSSIEHKTSIECAKKLVERGFIELSLVAPDLDSRIDPINVANEIRPNTCLVSVMHINNETGAINDIRTIGTICKTANVLFHSDCVQSFGKSEIPMPSWNVDALTMSMHKIYGPQGVGVLVMSNKMARVVDSSGASIAGSQWNGLHGGTVNTPGIAASLAAMTETFKRRKEKNQKLLQLKQLFVDELSRSFPIVDFARYAGKPETYGFEAIEGSETDPLRNQTGFVVLGPTAWGLPDHEHVSPNCILFSLPRLGITTKDDRMCNIKIKKYLADRGFTISIGSACNTSSAGPSHVLDALEAPFVIRSAVLRVSMTDFTSAREVRELSKLLKKAVAEQIVV